MIFIALMLNNLITSFSVRISHRHKFVFLATPRTASTSVRDALDDYSDIKSVYKTQVSTTNPFYHHISVKELIPIFNERKWDWDEYESACFVRNPYDRVVSLYHHYLETGSRTAPDKSLIYNVARKIRYKYLPLKNFAEYVRSINIESRLQIPVSKFVQDEAGEVRVSSILKFEDLPNCFCEWSRTAGVVDAGSSLHRLNSSRERRDYRGYYNEETRQIVHDKYRDDIDKFNYEF